MHKNTDEMVKACVDEYKRIDITNNQRASDDEKHGAKCAVRGIAVRLGVYVEFNNAMEEQDSGE